MDVNIHEIYNLLFAGKTIKIPFSSDKDAEAFRVKLARYKRQQDMLLLGANIIEGRQSFSFQLENTMVDIVGYPMYATLAFRDKDVAKTYSILIVPEDPAEKDTEEAV